MSEATSQAQTTTQTTVSVYVGPPLETIRTLVASQFLVKDAFLDPYGVPTVLVAAEPVKQKFVLLLRELAQHNLVAVIRGQGETLTLKFFQKPQIKPARRMINLVLFIATFATVLVAGLIIWQVFAEVVDPGANSLAKAGEFAGGLLAIIGLHEFGHKAATRYHRLDATLPYFIPGPPPFVPFGTFGAVISLREPPRNRDQLFDLGLSGPLVGFIVMVVVGIMAILLGLPLTDAQIADLTNRGLVTQDAWPMQPMILFLIGNLQGFLRPGLAESVLYSQLFFAVRIGALLTFLNLIPAWQLDGGHIWRATFGAEGHRTATMLGIFALFVPAFFGFEGYIGFAILLLVFMSLSRRGLAGVEPLDDISPISISRKIMFVVGLVALFMTFSLVPF